MTDKYKCNDNGVVYELLLGAVNWVYPDEAMYVIKSTESGKVYVISVESFLSTVYNDVIKLRFEIQK